MQEKKRYILLYVSKHNSDREKKVILLMIPNGKGWHYIAVKHKSEFLRGIMSKDHGKFYCLNCLHCFRTENKLKVQKRKIGENKDFSNILIPSEDTKKLERNQHEKSDKLSFMHILNV